jgi:hypothetical protein
MDPSCHQERFEEDWQLRDGLVAIVVFHKEPRQELDEAMGAVRQLTKIC